MNLNEMDTPMLRRHFRNLREQARHLMPHTYPGFKARFAVAVAAVMESHRMPYEPRNYCRAAEAVIDELRAQQVMESELADIFRLEQNL